MTNLLQLNGTQLNDSSHLKGGYSNYSNLILLQNTWLKASKSRIIHISDHIKSYQHTSDHKGMAQSHKVQKAGAPESDLWKSMEQLQINGVSKWSKKFKQKRSKRPCLLLELVWFVNLWKRHPQEDSKAMGLMGTWILNLVFCIRTQTSSTNYSPLQPHLCNPIESL